MSEPEALPAVSDARVLALVVGATLLVLVAFTTVITTVTATAAEFGAGVGWQTWALGGMSLGLAAGLLTAGSLADLFGHRRVFVGANLGLAAAALLGVAAPSMLVFVAARVLQGFAGAGVLAAGLGLLARRFPPGRARTRATGLWGAALGAGIAVGPVLAAAISESAGWRVASALTVAGGLAATVAARGLDRAPRTQLRSRLDLPGAALMVLAMGCLLGGITAGRTGWTSPVTLGLLAGGLGALTAFVVVEGRRREPMLDLAHFANPMFLASVGGAAVTGLATIALMSYMPAVLQRGLGLTALASGAVLALWSATSTGVAALAGRLPARLDGTHRLLAGLLASGVGLAGLAVLGSEGASWWVFAPGLVVAGVGSGLANAALAGLAVESVPAAQAAVGSGANNTARYLGAALGIAVVVAVVAAGGPGAVGLAAGWNHAAWLTGVINLAGAGLAALAIARRRRAHRARSAHPVAHPPTPGRPS